MNDNRLPHDWHDTTLYGKQDEDRIPFSAWIAAVLAIAALFAAAYL